MRFLRIRLLSGLLTCSFLVAGCGSSEADDGEKAPLTTVATPSQASTTNLRDAPALATFATPNNQRVEVVNLQRITANAVVARFRIATDDTTRKGAIYADFNRATYFDYPQTFAPIYAIDTSAHVTAFPMIKPDQNGKPLGRCLCTNDPKWGEKNLPVKGAPVFAYEVLQIPEATTSVFLASQVFNAVSGSVPITPISSTFEKVENEPDAGQVTQALPLTFPIVTRVGAQQVSETPSDVSVSLASDILFDFDKSTLTAKASQDIALLASRLQAEASGTVRVTGYTDDQGTDSYNLDLSKRRAQTVKDALASTGLPFAVEGKGEADPVTPNTSDQARRQNRRVTVQYSKTPPATTTTLAPSTTSPPAGTPAAVSVKGTGEMAGLTINVEKLRRISSDIAVIDIDLVNTTTQNMLYNQWVKASLDGEAGFESSGIFYNFELNWMYGYQGSQQSSRYYYVKDSTSHCLCSKAEPALKPNETRKQFALLTVPPGATSIDLFFYGFGKPATSVPIA